MIDNIFTALVKEKTPGVILEFILWCTVCLAALLSLIALAMGGGNVTWILLMLFSVGLAVLMAFRLKPVVLLYSVGTFYFIMLLVHYLCLSIGYYGGESHSPLNIVLFILALMLSLAIVTCAFIQAFSRFRLGTVLTILVLCDTALIMLLQILMYTAEYVGLASYLNSNHKMWMNYRGYWIGTVSFWILLAVTAVFYACFYWGPIDNRKEKIYVPGQRPAAAGFTPGLQGLCGNYAGRTIYLQGRSLTVGSGEGADVVIPDGYVSNMHCQIGFNRSTGFYEILDQSSNGIWLSDGTRLPKGVYSSVRRGSAISVGSNAQQFRLL